MDKENVAYTHNKVLLSCKKNEIFAFATKWMELEIMLSEISQPQKGKYHMFLSYVEVKKIITYIQ